MAHLVPYLVLFIILNLYEIVSAVLLPERWTSQSNLLQRVLGDGDDGESISSSLFLFGNLGRIEVRASRGFASVPLSDYDHESIKRAAARAIESILASRRILDGDEDIRPTEQDASVDEEGDYHVRLQQYVDGMPVEGSSLMVHFRNDGIIYATNGEVSSSTDIMDMGGEPMRFGLLECDDAVDLAAQEAGIASGSWISDCENAAVRGFDGVGHVAFKRLIGYQLPGEHYQRTVVFANKIDGRLLALHPRTHGEKSLLTYDCMGRSDDCSLRSNSTLPINTPMVSLNAAHNFTIATLDYYMSEFGRDSFDGRGMAVVSYANYGDDYSNAFWDGEACWYGSGDGTTFRSFSLALDIVAHEVTHGFTEFTSGLVYAGESGALNEAISDIVGATVEHSFLRKSIAETFLLAEDIYIKGGGTAVRSLADPQGTQHVGMGLLKDVRKIYCQPDYRLIRWVDLATEFDQVDFYDDRYKGWLDFGGVHNNSGIVNLAFSLMARGGTHPRGKSNVIVPAIDPANFTASLKAAAALFVNANHHCLTPGSSFYSARRCTLMFAGPHAATVNAAWDAVGVFERRFTQLQDGEELVGQNGAEKSVMEYSFQAGQEGDVVTCFTAGADGNADLFLRVNEPAEPAFSAVVNDCASLLVGSNEECTTKLLQASSTVYAALDATEAYANLTVACARVPATRLSSLAPPLGGLSGSEGSARYFAMELYYWDPSAMSSQVTCQTYGGDGDVDLLFRFGNLPKLSPAEKSSNDCMSATPGTSEESCTARYRFRGARSSTAFVVLHGRGAYSNVSLACARYLPDLYIRKGGTMWSQLGFHGSAQRFILRGVQRGEQVSCKAFTDYPSGGGAISLYVRLGRSPDPYPGSALNHCSSTNPVGSFQQCTAPPSRLASDTAYVTVVPANVTDWYFYSVYLTCSTCKGGAGTPCMTHADCCLGYGGVIRTLTCDGPRKRPNKRLCRPCRRAKVPCFRDTQCCNGRCINKRCQAGRLHVK